MANKLLDMKNECNKLIEENRSIHDLCETEKREPTIEEQDKFNANAERVDSLKAEAAVMQSGETRSAWLEKAKTINVATGGHINKSAATEIRSLFADMKGNFQEGEIRTLSALQSNASAGGYSIPTELNESLEAKIRNIDAIEKYARVINTAGGNPLKFLLGDGTGNAAGITAENTAATDDNGSDPVFSEVTLNSYKLDSEVVNIPFEMTQDSVVDIVDYVSDELSLMVADRKSYYHILGTGTSQPKGLTACAYAHDTLDDEAAVTEDEILGLLYSFPSIVRNSGNLALVMHSSTEKALLSIKSEDGVPLWVSGYAQGLIPGAPATFRGARIITNDYMPELGALNKFVVIAVNLNKFVCRSAGPRRITSQYDFSKDVIKLRCLERVDSNLVAFNTQHCRGLKTPSST